MNFRIASGNLSAAHHIEEQLLKDLRQHLPQTENAQLIYTATDNAGTIFGGVTASTAYSWLLIKTLWVHENHRRESVGKSLMRQSELAGKNAGCHSAWLDTSNPSAKLFYEKLGYNVFAELQNSANQLPQSHARWFMKKSL